MSTENLLVLEYVIGESMMDVSSCRLKSVEVFSAWEKKALTERELINFFMLFYSFPRFVGMGQCRLISSVRGLSHMLSVCCDGSV